MPYSKPIDILELSATLESLKQKRDELIAQRDLATTPQTFDTLSKELAQADRLISLQGNRLRVARLDQDAESKAAAQAKLQADLARIDELKSSLDEADEYLFIHLRAFYGQVQGHLDALHEMHKLTEVASAEAKDLSEPPVPISSLSRMGAVWNQHIDKIADDLIASFSSQFWQAYDARRNGIPVRDDFPCVLSLNTVGRVSDWSPWVVKPEEDKPAPEPTPEVEME
jgi:DNA repair exonuclease SbcCD ATPase subunit